MEDSVADLGIAFVRAKVLVESSRWAGLPVEWKMLSWPTRVDPNVELWGKIKAALEHCWQGTIGDFRRAVGIVPLSELPPAVVHDGDSLCDLFHDVSRMVHGIWNHRQRQRLIGSFAFVEYVAGCDCMERSGHGRLNGKIFRTNEDFVFGHTPPWESACDCDLISRTKSQVAGKSAAKCIGPSSTFFRADRLAKTVAIPAPIQDWAAIHAGEFGYEIRGDLAVPVNLNRALVESDP